MDLEHISTGTDPEFVAEAVRYLAARIEQNIADCGHSIVGLSGGSTPGPVYEALGKESIDWSKVTVFLVDERSVPADHPESNQRMIRNTLLQHANIPEHQIIVPNTALPIDDCVADYEQRIAEILSRGIAHIVILGMGSDGHIASLFPPLEENAFGDRLVLHTQTNVFAVRERISVSMIILGSAERKIFLLSGTEKKKVWEEMLLSDEDMHRWPALAVLKLGGGVLISKW